MYQNQSRKYIVLPYSAQLLNESSKELVFVIARKQPLKRSRTKTGLVTNRAVMAFFETSYGSETTCISRVRCTTRPYVIGSCDCVYVHKRKCTNINASERAVAVHGLYLLPMQVLCVSPVLSVQTFRPLTGTKSSPWETRAGFRETKKRFLC